MIGKTHVSFDYRKIHQIKMNMKTVNKDTSRILTKFSTILIRHHVYRWLTKVISLHHRILRKLSLSILKSQKPNCDYVTNLKPRKIRRFEAATSMHTFCQFFLRLSLEIFRRVILVKINIIVSILRIMLRDNPAK